jgi:hypothetical protein
VRQQQLDKFASLESDSGTRHSYVGTLCTITTLNEAAPGTVATCRAVASDPHPHYARCQRLDDSPTRISPPHQDDPDTRTDQSDPPPLGLRATPSDEKPMFSTDVTAVSAGAGAYSDSTVLVEPSAGKGDLSTCFKITFATFSSTGCLDAHLLATGLACAAFQDGDAPVDLVGIVPDDVATIDTGRTRCDVGRPECRGSGARSAPPWSLARRRR